MFHQGSSAWYFHSTLLATRRSSGHHLLVPKPNILLVIDFDSGERLHSHFLAEAGYRSAYVGKWHSGVERLPVDLGIEGWSQPDYGPPTPVTGTEHTLPGGVSDNQMLQSSGMSGFRSGETKISP